MESLKTEIAKLKYQPPQTLMEEFKAVVLTIEEIDQAILDAKIKKYYVLKDQEKQERILQMKSNLTRPWTFYEMNEAATKRANALVAITGHPEYLFDEHTSGVFRLLCQYFTNDPAFETDGRSLKKGILLQGNVGVGKTDLLRAFELNRRRCFITITADEISTRIKEHGLEYWETYAGFVPGHGSTPKYFLQPNIGWLVDDLGTENPVKDFGNPVDPLYVIIAERYKQKEKIPFNSMHITTNLNGDMIEKRYDYRFKSRLREMFNVIVLNGSDRRV